MHHGGVQQAGGGSAAVLERDDAGSPHRSVASEVTKVREGLAAVIGWLREVEAGGEGADPRVVASLVTDLGHVDSAVVAAMSRAIVVADVSGCPDADGAASTTDWVAGRLQLSATAAARACRLAVGLDRLPDVLAALEADAIFRDHAIALVDADQQQRRDHELAERARRKAEREAAERARREAEAAARAAADAAEAERLRQAAAEAERQRQAEAERQAAERAAAAEADRRDRHTDLLGRAAAGARPEDVADAAAQQRAADVDAMARSEHAQWAGRSVRTWTDAATGAGCGRWALPAADHEALLAALESLRTHDDPAAEPDERRSFEQRQADSFIDLIHRATAAGDLPTTRGQKPHFTVTVPLSTLTGEQDTPGRTRGGATLSPAEARRIACDAALTRVVLDATSMVLDVGRETRVWTAAQHKAAEVTFGGCAFPVDDARMCGRPIGWTELHHVRFWRHRGRTDRDNGVPLCKRHHRAVHHDGWQLTYDHTGQRITVTRRRDDGSTLERAVDLARRHPDAPGARQPAEPQPVHDGRLPL